jgi:hypothetical protein
VKHAAVAFAFPAAVGALLLASCAQLAGITGDYTVADGGLDVGLDDGHRTDGFAHGDSSSRSDGGDAASEGSAHDGENGETAPDSSPGCSPPKTICGSDCVDLDTDLSNCGHCGTTCSAAAPTVATCAGGLCELALVPEAGLGAVTIALGTSDVYVATGLGNVVASVPKGGGTVVTLVDSDLPVAIGTDGTDVYWGTFGTGGGVYKCPVTGCASPTTLATSELLDINLAVGGGYVFWNEKTTFDVLSCATGGCGETPKVRGTTEANSRGFVVYKSDVYWASPGGGTTTPGIFSQPLGSPSATPTTVTSLSAQCLAIDSSGNLYWATAAGEVTTCEATSCTPRPLLTALYAPFSVYPIATDGVSVYWSDQNEVYKCSVSGCSTPTVIPVAHTEDIAVDTTSLYLANGTGGLLQITPK